MSSKMLSIFLCTLNYSKLKGLSLDYGDLLQEFETEKSAISYNYVITDGSIFILPTRHRRHSRQNPKLVCYTDRDVREIIRILIDCSEDWELKISNKTHVRLIGI